MIRKVKINFVLVGKSTDIKKMDSLDPQSIINSIKNNIRLHFGERKIVIPDETNLINQLVYPKYYSAGWFVSDEPIGNVGVGSELVLVSHGETMADAQREMMKTISVTDWDNLAQDII